jgi:ParB/RepB/Spo0J family partition protein
LRLGGDMLSAQFDTILISEVKINRDERIRKEIRREAVASLAESISRVGLLHPIVLRRDSVLIAGETRLTACKSLGWTHIPFQYFDNIEPDQLLSVELEENVKRSDLTWQEQCDALAKYHALKLRTEEGWTQEKTAEALGMSVGHVTNHLNVAKELASGNKRVGSALKLSTAIGVARRGIERKKADQLATINLSLSDDEDDGALAEDTVPLETPILNVDFVDWAETYSGAPFNLIHCDFPYGINADEFAQGAAKSFGGYDDSPETYWKLVDALLKNRYGLMGQSAHIIFWFSMQHYGETLARLQKHFWVDPYPLVWQKSDNRGVIPDPNRGPRRIYETAFLASHGDRKIISAKSNAFAAPTSRLGEHMSEKNVEALKHFMGMVADGGTRLLDPTCGSGSALRAGRDLGVASVLGLEINPEFCEMAARAWRDA